MSRLVERASGAQVLPAVADQRATMSAYVAHCAADADIRALSRGHRLAAEALLVMPDRNAL